MAMPTWDLFCRVVDNLGDAGVCWRLAVDLAGRGQAVRLWIDDAAALAWMAPGGAPGVDVRPWPGPGDAVDPGDVVVEAFGCALPDAVVAAMAARARPPVWIDVEYLSAEDHAARSHGLPSPQSGGLGTGLVKWFFFPGFVDGTGGLIREPGLLAERAAFDRPAWLADHGIAPAPEERLVSLFCYDPPALPALLDALAATPTLLLLAPGTAARRVTARLGDGLHRGALRGHALPWLAQTDFDRLLWSCDLNFVRGEDSFVRAQWAGAPFVWQAYRQDDGAHRAKVDAFLALHLAGAEPRLRRQVESLWRAWNDDRAIERLALPPLKPWADQCALWRDMLVSRADLATRLLEFVRGKG